MREAFDLSSDSPHRRYNPLTGEWLLVSPQRTKRPWLGQVEKPPPEERPRYDPTCYLCPGNERAGGARNPDYEGTFVFENDFAALLPGTVPDSNITSSETEEGCQDKPFDPSTSLRTGPAQDRPFDQAPAAQDGLLVARAEPGICRVICFSPRHDLTLPEMELPDIRRVVDVWAAQVEELGSLPQIDHVQVFENKGAMMGASNPHPHGQVWASMTLPNEPAKEMAAQAEYRQEQGRCLLCSYLTLEERLGERLVCANQHFAALVPFWAVWPFETMLLSRRHVGSLPELSGAERDGLADIMRRLTSRYDNLFEVSFPYSMGFHQRPTDGRDYPGFHLHAHYYPAAAARLRELSETHHKLRAKE